MSPVPRQTVMTFGTWGGWRPGAGRKPSKKRSRRVPHRARPRITGREPLHVTLRVCPEVCSLRTKKKHSVIRAAFVAACNGQGFRIIDWSIQGDHLHLLVEARDLQHLSRGMQGFSVRVARGLNRLLERRGAIFVGRYYVRVLETPREVRNAKAYILNNHRRHAKRSGAVIAAKWVDSFSSWAWTRLRCLTYLP